MRNTARLLAAALLSLTAGPAFAQCTSMAANTVCGRLAIPAGGGSAEAISFPAFAAGIAPNFNWLRVTSIQNPASGSGMELGYDGLEGVIQSYSNRATNTLSPIFYRASSHQFTGSVGIGATPPGSAIFEIYPGQTIAGSRGIFIASDQNAPVFGAFGPINITWGSSNGAPWDASAYTGDNEVLQIYSYSKTNTFNFRPLHITGHLTAGTGAAVVGALVQAYIDTTTTTPRGGTGLEVLMQTSNGGDIWALNPGVTCNTVACGVMHGAEFDLTANSNPTGIHGVAIVGSGTGSASGTVFVTGFPADTKPISDFILMAQSGLQLSYGIMSASTGVGGVGPIKSAGSLWLSGGYTVAAGLEWGRMTFSDSAIQLPNNAPIKSYNAAGNTLLPILNLNGSNIIAIGAGATVDQSSGGATFGSSTMTSLSTTGTAGAGFVDLGNQSSNPSTPSANHARLYSNSAGAFSFKSGNGFVTTFNTTANVADRGYIFPDANGTVTLTSNNLSVFAATTSAQLAGVLSDETGSGVAVFGTAPTISAGSFNGASTFIGTSGAAGVNVRSGASGTIGQASWGRTTDEGQVGVAAGVNDFIVGTAAGDFVVRAATNLWLSSNAGGSAVKLASTGAMTIPGTLNGRTITNGSFSANKNGTDQSGIASATLTNVTFGTAASNVGSFYNTGTSTWTPPAGPILIVAQLFFTGGVVDQNQYQVTILKNGVAAINGISFSSGASGAAAIASLIDVANGTDAYTVQAYGGGAGTKTVNGGATNTYFQGTML